MLILNNLYNKLKHKNDEKYNSWLKNELNKFNKEVIGSCSNCKYAIDNFEYFKCSIMNNTTVSSDFYCAEFERK